MHIQLCRKTTWCACEELVGHVSQREDGDHAVVTVGFNKVVASDGCWIDVVLSEGSNERLQRGQQRGTRCKIHKLVCQPKKKGQPIY